MEKIQKSKSLQEIQLLGMEGSIRRRLAKTVASELQTMIEKSKSSEVNEIEVLAMAKILKAEREEAQKYGSEYLGELEIVQAEGIKNPAYKTLCEYVSFKEELIWISEQLSNIPTAENLLKEYNEIKVSKQLL